MKRLFAATTIASAVVAMVAWAPSPPVPAFDETRASWCPSDQRVLDRHGEVLHESRTDPSVRRLAWTSLEDVSPALVRAVVASEDRRFETHAGVDWRAVVAAGWQRAAGGPPRGASTITMQVAAFLDPTLRRGAGPRGLATKARQMRAAFALEERWTKSQILEAYLNLVPFRGEIEGVRAAAETVYGKAPHALTTGESAALAASIRSPNAPSEKLRQRSVALARTLGDGCDAEAAIAAGRLASTEGQRARTAAAPHASRALLRGAAPCVDAASTLDARVQSVASSSLRRHLLDLADRSAADGAVLVADNDSGEILAYVGSTGDLSTAREVDGVRAPRQAGSTLKPFLFARAIERGLVTAATLVEDTPFEIAVDDRVYRPENYDHRFRGLVSVRTALAASLNIPAVRVLTLLGEEDFADTLRALGLDGVRERGEWYGPSLALGSADVTLWDLVGAYRALARGGEWSSLRLNAAFAGDSRRRVFDGATAWLVADILSDRESRAATFELDGPLSTRFWTAAKTGTSKDMRDNWCIGFSRRFTVGVWVGNFSGAPMRDVSGVTGAAPVWREVMEALHEDVASDSPAAPAGVVSARTAFAGDAEPARREWYRHGTEPAADHVSTAGRGPAELDAHPRIVSPSDGSVLSLDPDTPPARQRVALVARPVARDSVWTIGDRRLGSADEPLLWLPERGSHELVLTDGAGRRVDSVRFRVVGAR